MDRAGLTDKLVSEQNYTEVKSIHHLAIWGNSFPGRGNRQCRWEKEQVERDPENWIGATGGANYRTSVRW